jgi:uncharacterized membrane protein YfcA
MENLSTWAAAGGWTDIGFVSMVFVLAGLVKGVTGMGLPTVAVALLSLRMAPMEAAALLIVPSVLTNLWQLLSGGGVYRLWQRLWPMLFGICVGTALVAVLVLSAKWTIGVLAAALFCYGLLGLSGLRWRVAATAERWLGPLTGVCTGLLSGASGVLVIPVVPYLQALNLEKEDLVQAMGMSFTASTLALATVLASQGNWQPAAAGNSFLAVIPAACGMYLGQRLRETMRPELFRRCFFIALLLLGAHLGWQAAWR